MNREEGSGSVLEALQRRVAGAHTPEKLAQLASELGHSIAGGQLGSREAHLLARAVGRARRGRGDFESGYLTALGDLLAAIASATADAAERAAAARAVDSSPELRRIVLALHDRPQGPSALARAVGLEANNGAITRQLQKLERLGIVDAAPAVNKKERPRQLTARGHRIASDLIRLVDAPEAPASSTNHLVTSSIVARAMAMVRFVSRCGEVSIDELAASAPGGSDERAALARAVAAHAELLGLVDVTTNDRVIWGRRAPQETWKALLEGYVERPDDLRAAFARVPHRALVGTDLVDAWRDVLGIAEVPVGDVVNFELARRVRNEFPAIVFTDRTVALTIARELSSPSSSTSTPLFVAEPRGAHIVVTPLAVH